MPSYFSSSERDYIRGIVLRGRTKQKKEKKEKQKDHTFLL